MSFLKPLVMTKKRFKFQITLLIDELNAVPFVTGVLYCKIRLRNGGAYVASTTRENVKDNCVCWRQRFEYSCKLSADPNTGILDPCVARLSVRKEIRGGRSATKIGFVDLNLAEFAGSGQTSRHCLLGGYNDNIRLDNSILKIVVGMQLLSGDPCFKVPAVREIALKLPVTDNDTDIHVGLDNASSGFGSLPRIAHHKKASDSSESFEPGHARNLSATSQQSKPSDYSSHHSRTPSNGSQGSTSLESFTEQDGMSGSRLVKSPQKSPLTPGRVRPPRPPPPHSTTVVFSQNRMDETRVSADDVVSKLIESQDFTKSSGGRDSDNLQLYVSRDGSTALGSQTRHNRVGSGIYHPVVFEHHTSSHCGLPS